MNTYVRTYWTSDLIISANKDISKLADRFDEIIRNVGRISTKYGEAERPDNIQVNYKFMDEHSLNGDNTCMMKGIAIDNLAIELESNGINDYCISFGGDIYMNSDKITEVTIEDAPNFTINVNGRASIFTSGNTDKRGEHIIGADYGVTTTVICNYDIIDEDIPRCSYNQIADTFATKVAANDTDAINSIELTYLRVVAKVTILKFKDGKLLSKVYCASPFFNEEQINTRDKMVSRFTDVFRPDLREAAKRYNSSDRSPDLAISVELDNINGIRDSEFLVFPNLTNDLGTLFEVGYAIGLQTPIIKYNEREDRYVILPNVTRNVDQDLFTKKVLVDCTIKTDVIGMGVLNAFCMCSDNILYQLRGEPDNIMLSVNFVHVELDTDWINVYETNYDEGNKSTKITKKISYDNTVVIPDDIVDVDLIYDIDVYNDYNDKVVTSVS